MTSGYSGTPLAKKLGIKSEYNILLYNPPKHYFDLFQDLPSEFTILKDIKPKEADFIHLFCTEAKELIEAVKMYKTALKKNGILWASWPKGKSNIPNDLNRELVRSILVKSGLVDIKVAAIDEDWSGLKFVYRLKDRK